MYHMPPPKQAYVMAFAMSPVIKKVSEDKKDDKSIPGHCNINKSQLLIYQCIYPDTDDLKEYSWYLLCYATAYVRERITEPVMNILFIYLIDQLNKDQCKIERDR